MPMDWDGVGEAYERMYMPMVSTHGSGHRTWPFKAGPWAHFPRQRAERWWYESLVMVVVNKGEADQSRMMRQ